jgi:biotin-dependent carboxylase-like uncharacterized protein
MSLQIERPGLLSTVQDLGRTGLQHLGVPVNGVMDEVAHRLANLLVGNEEAEATLEMTLSGPRLRFGEDAVIAVCGADMEARAGERLLPAWRPVRLPRGTVLDFGRATRGARTYLAVAGGFDLPPVFGSRSTALMGGYGGHRGRALRKGDALPLRQPELAGTPRWTALLARTRQGLAYPGWSVSRAGMSPPRRPQMVRLVPGLHHDRFSEGAREQLTRALYRVARDSDRMGFRLEGAPLTVARSGDGLSEGMVMGAIQVPPDGNPIVLMADRQTAGGYPVIAVVAHADLPLMGQVAPGDDVQFRFISLAESHGASAQREFVMGRIRQALSSKLAS